jgi:7-cyano-7-deazaguanine reductase
MKLSDALNPLGQTSNYASRYEPRLLFPISRLASRKLLGITTALPFYGCDIWTGYELSWLNAVGKPQVAVAEFIFPCGSHFIVESKSFKLYLNSLNQTQFNSFAAVRECLQKDLSAVAGAQVTVNVMRLNESALQNIQTITAMCLDDLDIAVNSYQPSPEYLTVESTGVISEALCSHLLKSNCPVTGQPDWASIFIEYRGQKINQENLLRYIISFREHQDFHEHCVERIFMDILTRCKPEALSVYARYTRRGGLDINPFRSTDKNAAPFVQRLLRQ